MRTITASLPLLCAPMLVLAADVENGDDLHFEHCTGCHDDKTAAWATERVSEWFPQGRTGKPHQKDNQKNKCGSKIQFAVLHDVGRTCQDQCNFPPKV